MSTYKQSIRLFGDVNNPTVVIDDGDNDDVGSVVIKLPYTSGLAVHLWWTDDAADLAAEAKLYASCLPNPDPDSADDWDEVSIGFTSIGSGSGHQLVMASNAQADNWLVRITTSAGSGTIRGWAVGGKEL